MCTSMRFAKCRWLAPILMSVVGINCDQGAVFIEDTAYFLPTFTPYEPQADELEDAGASSDAFVAQ
jgi:hypothetical protein